MIEIPFTKAHGARNDFLLTIENSEKYMDRGAIARAICDRYTGVGADGWMLVRTEPEPSIELYNSDGSQSEISGNGTRCAAAFLVHLGVAGSEIAIRTGAGVKRLKLLRRDGPEYRFEMDMGVPAMEAVRFSLPLSTGARDVTLLNVGNPQCAVPVEDFDFDWRAMGREIESHPQFPNRTNVSFIHAVDEHTVDARFYERGAGETMSSGTGSTGAAAAAIARGLASSPVSVLTPAGPLVLRENGSLFLTGPAELTAEGTYHLWEHF